MRKPLQLIGDIFLPQARGPVAQDFRGGVSTSALQGQAVAMSQQAPNGTTRRFFMLGVDQLGNTEVLLD
jgi:hypothetical protein